MGESGTAKVCPYCEGKGYVSVTVDLPPDDNPREELSRTTWVRKSCPLCDGRGRISSNDESPNSQTVPIFRQTADVSAVTLTPSCWM